MEWSNKLVLECLELYELEEAIWNPKHEDHKNKLRVVDAWENIRKGLLQDLQITELKKKKEGLMATYRSSHQKVQKSKGTGTGADEVYNPSWFCYKQMDNFLQNIYRPRHTVDTETSETLSQADSAKRDDHSSDKDVGSIINTNESDKEESVNRSAGEAPSQPNAVKKTFQSPLKRKMPNSSSRSGKNVADIEKRMDEAYSMLKTVTQKPQQSKDECDIYGELIASKLRKFDEESRDILMHDIDDLIFRIKLKFGNSSQSSQVVQSQYPCHLQSSVPSYCSRPFPSPNQSQSHSQSFLPSPSYSNNTSRTSTDALSPPYIQTPSPYSPKSQVYSNEEGQTNVSSHDSDQTAKTFLDSFTMFNNTDSQN